jgi:hypothetical protein
VQGFAEALREVAEAHGEGELRSRDVPTEGPTTALPIGIGKPTLSTRMRVVFLAVGAAVVIGAVGLMASSLQRNVPVATPTATAQPQTLKLEVPSPTPRALDPDTKVRPAPAPAGLPPAGAHSVVSKVRSHQKRHLREHSRHGASHGTPGRRPRGL